MVLIHVADHKEFRTWLRRDYLWHRGEEDCRRVARWSRACRLPRKGSRIDSYSVHWLAASGELLAFPQWFLYRYWRYGSRPEDDGVYFRAD